MTLLIPCKFHAARCGIRFAKQLLHTGPIKLQRYMTTQESKMAEELESRLQEQARQGKKSVYRSEIKAEGLDNMVRTPLRIHQQMIQRAQFYTGDA